MSTGWWPNEMLDLWLSTTRLNTSKWQPQTKRAFHNDHLCFMINRRRKYSSNLQQCPNYCSLMNGCKLAFWQKSRGFSKEITSRLSNFLHDRLRIKILSKCQVIHCMHWIVSLFLFDKTLFIPFHRDQITKETLFHHHEHLQLHKTASFERMKVTRSTCFLSPQQNNLIIYILDKNTGYIWFLI